MRWLSERKQLTATTPLATLALGLPAAAACCRLTELPAWCWAYCALSQLPHRMWNVESWSVGCLSNPPTPAMDHATAYGSWLASHHRRSSPAAAVCLCRAAAKAAEAPGRIPSSGQGHLARPGRACWRAAGVCCGPPLLAAGRPQKTEKRAIGDWRLAMDNEAGFVSAANDKVPVSISRPLSSFTWPEASSAPRKPWLLIVGSPFEVKTKELERDTETDEGSRRGNSARGSTLDCGGRVRCWAARSRDPSFVR